MASVLPGSDNAAGGGRADRAAGEKQRSLMLRLLGLTWSHRRAALVDLFWSMLVQGLLLASFVYSGLALDVMRKWADGRAPEPKWPLGIVPPSGWGAWAALATAAGLVLGMTVLRSAASYMARVADESLIQEIIVKLRTDLYAQLQGMSFGWFDSHDTGGLINRVTTDAGSVRMFIQGVAVKTLIAIATLALFLGYMLKAHAWLTLAVLSVLPVQAFVLWRYAKESRPHLKAVRESNDRLVQTLQESVIGVKVVKGFGQERQMIERFGERIEDFRAKRMPIAWVTGKYMPLMPVSAFVQLSILLLYGGHLVQVGRGEGRGAGEGIALGTLWVFLGLLRQLAAQIDVIVSSASSIPEALTGAERVFELLDARAEISSPERPEAKGTVLGRITFEGVTFRYGEGPAVLEGIDLDIRAGERIALVGPAGSGKSTLLALVPRFQDPVEGRVLVDGVDVRGWDLCALRRGVGLVFQEAFLFSNTIGSNVAYGKSGASEAEQWAALRSAAAEDFVRESERGLETIIGERGLTLSGGQRQRLSLARAMLPAPPVLLLDDTTAAVDARTEGEISESLNRLMRGRTTIIVSHRLTTLRRADRIVVLERGRITDIGTHEELMERSEHYRTSALLQLARDKAEMDEASAAARGVEMGEVVEEDGQGTWGGAAGDDEMPGAGEGMR